MSDQGESNAHVEHHGRFWTSPFSRAAWQEPYPDKDKSAGKGTSGVKIMANSRNREPHHPPASTLGTSRDLIIMPCHLLDDGLQKYINTIPWYNWWVRQQLDKEPKELFSIIPDYNGESQELTSGSFMSIWREIWDQMTVNGSTNIDSIVTHLIHQKILNLAADSDSMSKARNLVFSMIGWQTMLYRPDMRSCSPTQLAIADDTDGYRGEAHFCLRQSQFACKSPLPEFLMGFGVLLPPKNFSAHASEVDKNALREMKTAAAESFNAHLLTYIAGVTITWIDCLACHLQFDASSNTLYLFRYPSFCLANLPQQSDVPPKTAIHACAAPSPTGAPWANPEEVSQLLQEIVLSYRLLFGQSKTSRQYFRSIKPFIGIPQEGRDEILMALCGRKRLPSSIIVQDREVYDLNRDFPILKSKLTVLLHHLSTRRPRTWGELWRDKRDSASWFTFWAVIIFGGIGLILAFIQVILAIMQVALQIKQMG